MPPGTCSWRKAPTRSGACPGTLAGFETSLVLGMRPDLVREPRPHRDTPGSTDPRRFTPLVREERHGFWQAIDGYGDSPDLGTAEDGQRYLEVSAAELARAFVAFLSASNG